MSDELTFKVSLGNAQSGVAKLIRKVQDKALMHDAIGQALVSRVVQGFDISTGPYGEWRPLSPVTINRRRKKSAKPLLDTGRLRNSITHEFDNNSARIGTNVEYAKYHQLGTKTIPARKFLPDKGLPREWEQEDVLDTVEALIKEGL